MRKYIIKFPIIKLIVSLEVIIYCSFLYLDFSTNYTSRLSALIKYIGILLCVALVLLIKDRGHDKEDTLLLQLAFCFTAAADFCLVILDYNSLGILLFCFVQMTYIIRHGRVGWKSSKFYKILLCIFIGLSISSLIILNLSKIKEDMTQLNNNLIRIACVYAAILLYSLYTAFKAFMGTFHPKYSRYLILLGMILFLLCDMNVGISGILNNSIGRISRFLVWIFYLPSQVLLALSGYRINKIYNILFI